MAIPKETSRTNELRVRCECRFYIVVYPWHYLICCVAISSSPLAEADIGGVRWSSDNDLSRFSLGYLPYLAGSSKITSATWKSMGRWERGGVHTEDGGDNLKFVHNLYRNIDALIIDSSYANDEQKTDLPQTDTRDK
jgi:hypothetical protein